MSFEQYKEVFDKLKRELVQVQLYNWGEPLLNKDIVKIIAYTHKNNVGAEISTNLQVTDDALLEKLIMTGLDRIIISCDGINQDMYEKYRKGGSFDKVVDNIKTLVRIKKQLGKLNPILEVQFIVFSFNEDYIEAAKKFFYKLGVDYVSISNCSLMIEDEWEKYIPLLPKNKKYQFLGDNCVLSNGVLKKIPMIGCDFFYRQISINPNGDVYPCCGPAYLKNENLGNMQDYPSLWNSQKYVYARQGKIMPCKFCFEGKIRG